MATEVAAVIARYIFRAEGQAQVAQAAESLRTRFAGVESAAQGAAIEVETLKAAQAALTATANTTSATVAKQRLELTELVGAYKEGSAAIDEQVANLEAMGTSVATLSSDIEALVNVWQGLRQAMENNRKQSKELNLEIQRLYDQRRKLNIRSQKAEWDALTETIRQHEHAVEQLKGEYGALNTETTKVENAIASLRAADTLLAAEGATRVEALTNIEAKTKTLARSQGSLERETRKVARATNLSQTELVGLIAALRSGNIGSSLMGSAMQRLGQHMIKLLPLLGIGALLTAAWRIAGSEAVRFGQALEASRPAIRGVYDDLQGLTNFGNQELLGFLEQATNRLQSFGAIDATGTAKTIAELANIGQFRIAGVGDAPRVAQMIQQAVEGVNFDPLRDLGVPVDKLNAKLQALAEDGMTKAAQRAQILNDIAQELNQDVLSGEAQARANAEFGTMEHLILQIQNAWRSLGRDPKLLEAVRNFVSAIREALPAIRDVIAFFAEVATAVVNVGAEIVQHITDPIEAIKEDLRELGNINKDQSIIEGAFGRKVPQRPEIFSFTPKGADKPLIEYKGATEEADDASKAFEETLKRLDDIIAGFDDSFERGADSLTRLQRAMQEAQGRQGAFGLIDSVKQLSVAINELDQKSSTANATAAMQAYDRVLTQVIEKGPAQLDLLRLQAERLFATGFIDQKEFEAITRGFDAIQDVVDPIEEEAAKIRGRLNESTTQTQNFGTAMQGVESAAAGVNGQVAQTAGLISNATGAAVQLAGVLGSIAFGGGGFALPFGGGNAGGATWRVGGPNFARQGAGGQGMAAADRALLNSAVGPGRLTSGERARNALDDVFDIYDLGKGGGGGGGGGGSNLATIEEIRALFRSIGELIKIGTNNGVFFSTAGNAIPLGGRNEFLNTSGGSLIQTVNIRGIWDFADPAAKRQIMKELEEALAQLKKETK